MEAKAVAKHVRMSPRKVRLVVDQIRGKSVNEAYAILQFSKKAAADPVSKTLRSAVANAEQKEMGDPETLRIERITVDPGPTLKRWVPRAMGRATPIRKRTSIITVVLTNE